ncbi:MAG: Kynureninase [Chlamydiae bacterium]|nr:Kynureninase [Chlamydiota bacterium]
MNTLFQEYETMANQLDANDPLKRFRDRFALPKNKIYLCNNSLGLPPLEVPTAMEAQLQKWANLGVDGWFQEKTGWYSSLDRPLRDPLSHLLGAKYDEVIVMNSLTVNLHLLMVSFYRPTETRYKILIEAPSFPSDLYALKDQIRYHGLDPKEALIIVEPRKGEHLLRQSDIEEMIVQEGSSIALVYLSCVNFLTGQLLDIEKITKLAKEQGCLVGYDVAHAAGNIPLELHRLQVDFAVGCSYKYLCSGPGGPGIAYVHSSHHDQNLPRFSGWWGNDPKTRFQMQLQPEFVPYGGAYSWQLSTPSILAMTPLLVSLKIFEEAGIHEMRKKSKLQTAFLLELLEQIPAHYLEIVTPENPNERGCQISLLIKRNAEKVLKNLENKGVICDFRPPNIIRVTPSPLYNTFFEIYQFIHLLTEALEAYHG